MSVVLGINMSHAGSSAALVVDGEPLVAIAEERLNRKKYYAGFPKLAINECLRVGKISASDIEIVGIGRKPSANLSKKISYMIQNPLNLLNFVKMKRRKAEMNNLKEIFASELGVSEDKLKFKQSNVEHHLAHISSAYYASGWSDAGGISIDGSGDFVTCMFANCMGEKIEILERVYVPHSLGSLYTMICEFIGYDRYGDEGKVMGLAPYGNNCYKEYFTDMVILTENGFELNLKYFLPLGFNQGMIVKEDGQVQLGRHYSDYVEEIFGPPRKRDEEITQRDKDLAFGLQWIFEKAYIHLINRQWKMTKNPRLTMAGGCTLNSVANGKIFDKTPFKETWIQPAAGDDGLSLGAALYVANNEVGDSRQYQMTHSYWGSIYTDAEIEDALRKARITYSKLTVKKAIDVVVTELITGNIVGLFQGKSEWGPRALGNRSILAHPGLPNMKKILNQRIKHREPFRPFAPVVMAERQGDIFECDYPSPFMLHVYKIKKKWREKLCAVNHCDNTGRLQTVSRSENKIYYDIISEFDKRTGIPVVINTSFNENEPVVNAPEEAIDCFVRTKMDAIFIGSFIALKREQASYDNQYIEGV